MNKTGVLVCPAVAAVGSIVAYFTLKQDQVFFSSISNIGDSAAHNKLLALVRTEW